MRVTIYLFFSFLFLCSQHLLKAAPYAGMLSSRVYVKVGGTGNGSSWATATGDLQTAIDNASGATEIWVAAGTYKPAAYPTGCVGCSSTRDYAFYVKDGISLYGGFVGTETLLSERNIATNITILSGDIGTPSDNTDNCYHVVVTSSPISGGGGVTIDGFTITGGNSNSYTGSITINDNELFKSLGGGIYTTEGTNTLSNNTLYNNSGYDGGGLSTGGGNNTLSNNTLYNNSATGDAGGGFGSGGGINTYEGTNTLTNNTLHDNSATHYGGGISTFYGTNTLSNNTLYNNSADLYGGGVATFQGNNTLTYNTLYNNSTDHDGGGIYTFEGTNTLTYNTLHDNLADSGPGPGRDGNGGGIYSDYSTNILNNNVLYNNSSLAGGGIYNTFSTVTLTNNTLYNNSSLAGGGILTDDGRLTLINNIFWKNNENGNSNVAWADIYNVVDATIITITHCLTQANSIHSSGTGIINNQDPLFINAATGDFRLQANSPCINVGSNGAWAATGLSTDVAGTTRPIGVVDMGAYEYTAVLPIELLSFTGKGTEGGNLLTWETANEVNNKGFQVERLAPPTPSKGENWEVLGFKTANNKAGTYEFMDNAPLSISTYRLRQIDFDGKETLSKVISIAATGKGKLKAYPNPVSDVLTIETTEISDYQIFNLLGQQVFNGKATQRIDVSALPQGTYFLKVGAEQVKFMKQ